MKKLNLSRFYWYVNLRTLDGDLGVSVSSDNIPDLLDGVKEWLEQNGLTLDDIEKPVVMWERSRFDRTEEHELAYIVPSKQDDSVWFLEPIRN